MNSERVFGLLSESNPVPDLSAVPEALGLSSTRLHFIESGRNLMQTDERNSIQIPNSTRDPKRRNRKLIAAATAVLVLIVGIGTLGLIGGDRDAAVEPEVSVVLSATEAQNSGDIDAYKASLTGAALGTEESRHPAEAMSYANSRRELADCRVTGTSPAGESIVECQSTSTDDFFGTGGIVDSGTARFLVTEDGRISDSGMVSGRAWQESDFGRFSSAFFTWLRDAHPTVFDDIGPARLTSIPGINWPDDPHQAEEMLIALEYVDEFVAQSDVYPINQ